MFLILDQVTHSFDQKLRLFPPISTAFGIGETTAIVGPSGSGKSTLLAILAELIVPTEGKIMRDGIFSSCWVTQNPHGVAGRTALDHVALSFISTGLTRSSANLEALAILDQFGLGKLADQPFGTLSGGQAQRLMLARGVAAAPHLLLVDEPTAQLDQQTAKEVDGCLAMLTSRKMIVVVATHSPTTRDACSRVLDLSARNVSEN